MVPGHEIVGEAIEVGSKVQKVKIGDKVGVGCMVGACHSCDNCLNDLENYCPKIVHPFNKIDLDGTRTYGGCSDHMVANERYIIRFPDNMPLDSAAPLLCAGITAYSPLKYYGLGSPDKHIGIVGLGGIGHMAVKFAKAMGAKVTVISYSSAQKNEALEHLGADSFFITNDQKQMEAAKGTLDGLLDTIPVVHPIMPLLDLLKPHKQLVLLTVQEYKPLEFTAFPLMLGRKGIVGGAIGGMKETQEMVDFAAKHNIKPDVEIISMDYANTAMERIAKSDVKYRFVIDIGNTLEATKPLTY